MTSPFFSTGPNAAPTLRASRLGLHTQHQAIAIMRTDCHVCRAEGLVSRSQILLSANGRQVQAILFQAEGNLVAPGEAALMGCTRRGGQTLHRRTAPKPDDTAHLPGAPMISRS